MRNSSNSSNTLVRANDKATARLILDVSEMTMTNAHIKKLLIREHIIGALSRAGYYKTVEQIRKLEEW